MKVFKNNMTEGVIWKQILLFAIPLLISNFFQQFYNTVDSVIVGNFIGDKALAAVGSSGPVILMLTGFFMGLSVGASVIISQYYGASDYEKVQKAVHTSIAMIIICGIFLTILGIWITPFILKAMGTPDSVLKEAIVYLKIYFYGILFVMIYNIGSSILRAVGDSKRPLYFLIISSVVNIILDIVFVVKFKMGIAGTSLATVIAQMISSILIILDLTKTTDCYKLQINKLKFDMPILKKIIKIGFPSGLQNMTVSFSNTLVQSSINSFGEIAIAGCSSYQKIEGFSSLPIFSFSLAMSTFVGQNIGAGKYDRVRKGTKVGIFMSCTTAIIISTILVTFAPQILKIFNSNPEVISYGVYMMRVIAPAHIILAIAQIIAGVLRGAGKTIIPMIAMFSFWCCLRVIWVIFGLQIFKSILVVFLGYPVSWLGSVIFLIIYMKKSKFLPRKNT